MQVGAPASALKNNLFMKLNAGKKHWYIMS
jgi:hypothetical protein